ncbi:MAG: sensor histidine kinase [bacterium]
MKKFWRNILIGFGFWTAYNFLNAGILSVQQNLEYAQAWISTAMANYPMALLSIALWFFCRGIPFEKSKKVQFLAIHIFSGTAFSGIWLSICYLIHILVLPENVHRYLIDTGVYLWQFLDGITKYGFLVGIFYTINFYQKFKEKELRETELNLLTKKMELQNLKSQINPHFLFNALNSVNALMAKDPEKARMMNAKLAQLLRFSLDGYDERFITLKQELEFIHNYLDIEKVRFGNKLTIHEKIAKQTLNSKVPSMLLQPLVENAIKHGISKLKQGGELSIHAMKKNGILNLEVANTGMRIPEASLLGFMDKGIGLKNTNERLKRLYGEAFGLRLESTLPNGLCVKIKIPQTIKMAKE